MFERESEFIPLLEYEDADRLNTYLIKRFPHNPPQDTVKFLDNLNYTGRKGAMWHFGKCLVDRKADPAPGERPTITIIGHSMGAIVACELLQRFHMLPVDNVVFEAAACSVSNFKTNVIPFLEEQNLKANLLSKLPTLEGNDSGNVVKTHVYNLCLHDDAENAEKNPGELDLSQRGSLLTWVDTLYQSPESENDRTFGRWVNAILATDDFPDDILDRITIKEFGRDRLRERHKNLPIYTVEDDGGPKIAEPTKHGEMTRYEPGVKKRKSNFKFWSKEYREREPKKPTAIAPTR
jgi:hypothetical protein